MVAVVVRVVKVGNESRHQGTWIKEGGFFMALFGTNPGEKQNPVREREGKVVREH